MEHNNDTSAWLNMMLRSRSADSGEVRDSYVSKTIYNIPLSRWDGVNIIY